MTETHKRRLIRPGELLAIRSDVVIEDRGAFFWLFAPPVAKTERIGGVAVVRVNGPLEYHEDACSDSYDSIVCRVSDAMAGGTDGDDDADDQSTPPHCVVLRIDSPGGVVAGLGQTVDKLRKMSRDAGIPLYAYVDETAYSAAFALSCACEQIVLPKAGMLGSIGVISTMVDQTKADAKMGLRFVVLTSGKRKADGHPHVPISDAMIAEEAPRVLQLAKQFYGVVNRARSVPIKTIQGWEASRFLGAEATRAGLADAVLSWDEFISTISKSDGKETQPLAQPARSVSGLNAKAEKTPMGLDIDALIVRTEKALVAEKDPTKLAAIVTNLEAYKKTKHSIEKHETEEGEDDEDDEEDEESESKGDETDRGDDEEDDEDDDEEDEKKSKAVVKSSKPKAVHPESPEARVMAAVVELTGQKDASQAIAALRGLAEGSKQLTERMARIEKDARKATRDTSIDKALNARRITKHEAKTLRTKKAAFVEQFLAMRPKAIIDTDEKDQPRPDQDGKTMSSLPPHVRDLVAKHVANAKAAGSKSITEEKVLAGLNGTNGKVEV